VYEDRSPSHKARRTRSTWSPLPSSAGGPTAAARLCRVRRQSIYLWIKEWKVERLVDALKLSRASGIPIENPLAG